MLLTKRALAAAAGPNRAAIAASASAADADALVPRPLPTLVARTTLCDTTWAQVVTPAMARSTSRLRTTRASSRPLACRPPMTSVSCARDGSNATRVSVDPASLQTEMLGRNAMRQSQSLMP